MTAALDYKLLFESVPGLYLILSPDLTIIDASTTYLNATLTKRKEITGRHLFEVFPDNPNESDATGELNLRASLATVIKTKKQHVMALQKYDVRQTNGVFIEKYWKPINTPVINNNNEIEFIIHSVEDVTEFVQIENEGKKQSEENLKILRELSDLQYAIDQSLIVSITDQKGIIQFVNDSFCKASKYSREELIGKSHSVISSGYHSEEFYKDMWATINSGKIWRGEIKNKTKTGEEYWDDTTITPFLNEMGKPYQYLSIKIDISERKNAEEELRKTYEFLDTVLENIPNMVFVKDIKELRFTLLNKAGEELLGLPKNELIGKNDYDFFPKEQADFFTAKDRESIQKNKLINIPKEEINTGNGKRYLHTKKIPVYNSKGLPVCLLGISEDITDRIKHEEEIKKINADLEQKVIERTQEIVRNEQKFKQRLDKMMEGVQIIDFNWKYVYVNEAVANQGRYKTNELIGYTMMEKYPGIENTEMFASLEMCMKERVSMFLENEFVYPDGSKAYFELSIQPVQEGIFILSMDISARKKAEQEIQKLNENLEIKVTERTAQLASVNKELESFSYSVSHDLRAPLRAISGYTKILWEDYNEKIDDEGRRLMNVVMNNANKMGQLIDDLLAFSRLGKQSVVKTPINMTSLITSLAEELKEQSSKKEIEIEIKPLLNVHGDASMIKQVLINLISNAIKYSSKKEKSLIEIGSYKEKNASVFYIKDNGVGFDMKYKDKLFGVFQRLHSNAEFDGTGVGLALVNRIISKHDGKIWADAKINEGATFYFLLPNN